jgi:hypothetical protein
MPEFIDCLVIVIVVAINDGVIIVRSCGCVVEALVGRGLPFYHFSALLLVDHFHLVMSSAIIFIGNIFIIILVGT